MGSGKNIDSFSKIFFNELGFRDAADYFGAAFGVKGMVAAISLQWLVAAAVGFIGIVQTWIWPAPYAFCALVILIIWDAHYGYLVAKKLKGEPFLLHKFWRTISILIAHVSQLVILHMVAQDYEVFEYIGQTVFYGLFLAKFRSLAMHYGELKLQTVDLTDIIKQVLANALKKVIGEKAANEAVKDVEEQPEKQKVGA